MFDYKQRGILFPDGFVTETGDDTELDVNTFTSHDPSDLDLYADAMMSKYDGDVVSVPSIRNGQSTGIAGEPTFFLSVFFMT